MQKKREKNTCQPEAFARFNVATELSKLFLKVESWIVEDAGLRVLVTKEYCILLHSFTGPSDDLIFSFVKVLR